MHTTEKLLKNLREEYMALTEKIDAANFALATLPLDDKAKSLLDSQVIHMGWYAQDLIDRAKYAANKEKEAVDDQ